MTAQENRDNINHIRSLLLSGAISYQVARAQAMPLIDAMNEVGKAIAKKHGKKYKALTFVGLMR